MRIAIFSDLHGNPYACRAVLRAIRQQGSFDSVIAAGDLCVGGSDPSACIDLLMEAGVKAVYGNTEEYLRQPQLTPPDERHRVKWHWIQPAVLWTQARLSARQSDWLAGLPFELRFSPTADPANDLLVVHANPRNNELMIYPSPVAQLGLWGQVRQPDDDPELVAALSGLQASVLAFGHFHHASLRRWQGLTLVNVAPCSLPGVDHDPRARFSILTWSPSGWKVSQHFVEYNYLQEVHSLRSSSLPSADQFLESFGL